MYNRHQKRDKQTEGHEVPELVGLPPEHGAGVDVRAHGPRGQGQPVVRGAVHEPVVEEDQGDAPGK